MTCVLLRRAVPKELSFGALGSSGPAFGQTVRAVVRSIAQIASGKVDPGEQTQQGAVWQAQQALGVQHHIDENGKPLESTTVDILYCPALGKPAFDCYEPDPLYYTVRQAWPWKSSGEDVDGDGVPESTPAVLREGKGSKDVMAGMLACKKLELGPIYPVRWWWR